MQVFTATVASDACYELGEGPLWDEARERVLWVDINAGTVHVGHLEGGFVAADSEMHFEETACTVVCDAAGELLVAGARRVYRVLGEGRAAVRASLVPDAKASRLNDGACDPTGRLLVGSMSLDSRRGEECLYRLEDDGGVTVLDDDLTISNGLAWSPAGDVMYSVDTAPGVVWRRPYDPASGAYGERAEMVRLTSGRLARRSVRRHRRQPMGGDLGRGRGALLHAVRRAAGHRQRAGASHDERRLRRSRARRPGHHHGHPRAQRAPARAVSALGAAVHGARRGGRAARHAVVGSLRPRA